MPTFVPYAPAFLASCASDACPCCAGGGIGLGYGLVGQVCACVARCALCAAPLPTDDEHYDEGRPRTVDGMPACPVCRERALLEDLRQVDGVIDRAYWLFTRTARGKPPVLVCPEAYQRRSEIRADLRLLRRLRHA